MTLRYTHLITDHKQQAVRALEEFGQQSPNFLHSSEEREQ
jgi:hypothetical protein